MSTEAVVGVAREAATEARAQCEQVLHRYFRCVDEGRASEAAPLFAPGATMQTPKARLDDHAAIAAALETRQAAVGHSTVHVATNLDFELADDGSATANGVVLLFAGGGDGVATTPVAVLRSDARFACDAGGRWQIAALVLAEAS